MKRSRRPTPLLRRIAAAALLAWFAPMGPGPAAQQQPAPAARTPTPSPAPTPAGARRPATPAQRGAPAATPAPGARPSGPAQPIPPPAPNAIRRGFNQPDLPEPEEIPTETEPATTTIIVKETEIERVLDKIKEDTGVVVKAMEQVRGQKVTITAREKTVEEVLNELALGQDWTWIEREDGTFEIWDKPSFIEKELRRRVIRKILRPRFVSAADVASAVEGVKSEIGAIAVNDRTNELIVTDLPDKVALIESLLRELDVQLYTRVFHVRYAAFSEIEERLVALKSEPGEIQVDPANRRLIVTDTLERIKRMEQLLEMLDVDRPMKMYHLSSIGLEGADAENLLSTFIEPIVTEGALVQFYPSQSVLVVKDVPEAHDQILELLKALDQSPKQVFIEGEILEVRQDFVFNRKTELTFDKDLAGAFRDQEISLPRVSASSSGLTVLELAGDVRVVLEALMTDADTRLLLQPRAQVRNNETFFVDLQQENPQITTFFNTTTGGFNNFASSSIVFVPTGLSLSLTPTISNRGLIEMDIDFENSSPIPVTLETPQGNQSAVGRNTQRIQTIMIIPSGQTRVLGGLISRSESAETSGVPFLSRIPLLGMIFGSKNESRNKRNLLFFLTPTIVQEAPLVDLIETPINAPARALAAQQAEPLVPPPLVEIPEALRPYLRSERPADVPAEEEPAQTLLLGPPTPEELHLPELERVEGMLLDEPPPPRPQPGPPLGVSGPGAELLKDRGGALGPSGRIGEAPRQAVRPRRTPTPTPSPSPTPPPGAAPRPTPPPAQPPPTPVPSPEQPQPTPTADQPPAEPGPRGPETRVP